MVNKKIGTLLLAGTMVMSMGTTVFAADGLNQAGTKDNPATVSVTKNLEFAEGISIPDSSFDFTASKIESVTQDAPKATINSIKYTDHEKIGKLENGKYVLSKTSEITFGQFPHAGEYQYKVKETTGKMQGMAYDANEYTLKVYVANADNNKLYIKMITASEKGKVEKPDNLLFTNTYRKRGGENAGDNVDSLVIRKDIKGELADKTKKFDFEVTFTRAATTPNTETQLTGKIGEQPINCTYDQVQTFTLGDGDELRFQNIPAGTRYKVTELGKADGYKPSVKVIENGVANTERTGNDADSVSSADDSNLIGENENKVTFTNTNDATPVTGIIAKNAPIIIVVALGVLGMLGYALIKRKIEKR